MVLVSTFGIPREFVVSLLNLNRLSYIPTMLSVQKVNHSLGDFQLNVEKTPLGTLWAVIPTESGDMHAVLTKPSIQHVLSVQG